MIYSLKYVSHPLERVNQVVFEFLNNSLTNATFSNLLFPVWFRDVITSGREFQAKFRTVFAEFRALQPAQRTEIFNHYNEGLDIYSICIDTSKAVILTENYASFHNSLKDLLKEHFWKALKTNVTIQRNLNTSLDNHYLMFKRANNKGKVCPFCGLHNYSVLEGEAKDSYDHWLLKAKYPLYAINFANLVPMCDSCNRTGVKGSKDLLHIPESTNRRRVYYPYQNVSGIRVEVDSFTERLDLDEEKREKFIYGYFNLSITAVENNETEQVETWKEVFNIQKRYNSFISEDYPNLKEEFEDVFLVSNANYTIDNDINNLITIITHFREQLGLISRRTSLLIEKAYLDYLCQNGNEHLLFAFCDVNLFTQN